VSVVTLLHFLVVFVCEAVSF